MCGLCGGFLQFVGEIGRVFKADCLNCGHAVTFLSRKRCEASLAQAL